MWLATITSALTVEPSCEIDLYPKVFGINFIFDMTTTTLITLSPEELEGLIAKGMKVYADPLAEIVSLIRPHKSVLTVSEIAADCGFSTETVRSWIATGRTCSGKAKKVKLKIIDGLTDGPYRVRWEAYREFLAQFPDVIATRSK